jgi:hypothetical protein
MKGANMARIGTRDPKYRRATERKRAKVYKRAKQQGYITNAEAARLGQWQQGFYHLTVLRDRGYLKQKAHNLWVPRHKKKYELRV